HEQYQVLSGILSKYPRAAGCLFQAYNDILYVQKWTDIEVVDLVECTRGLSKGADRRPCNTLLYVVPCSLAETASFSWLTAAFSSLSNPPELYLAVTSDDASIVYYKISLGIVKPPV
ncbi:tRNA intron endonuclease, partial [Infundibulicybe gibba]